MSQEQAQTFLETVLDSIGMHPESHSQDGRKTVFEGDGYSSRGSYTVWNIGNGALVTMADYEILRRLQQNVRYPEFVGVRHDLTKAPGRNELMVFAWKGEQVSRAIIKPGTKCRYIEVYYLADYLNRMRAPKTQKLAINSLESLDTAITWSREIALPFEAIERCEKLEIGTLLTLSGAADMLMGTMLGMIESPPHEREDHKIIAEVITYIDNNLDKPLRQEGMLGLAKMSASKFKILFKKVTGLSMSEYIFNRRIEKAKALISKGVPVKNVASDTGMGSAANFTTAFKRATGVTPTQWKEASRIEVLSPTTTAARGVYQAPQTQEPIDSTSNQTHPRGAVQ